MHIQRGRFTFIIETPGLVEALELENPAEMYDRIRRQVFTSAYAWPSDPFGALIAAPEGLRFVVHVGDTPTACDNVAEAMRVASRLHGKPPYPIHVEAWPIPVTPKPCYVAELPREIADYVVSLEDTTKVWYETLPRTATSYQEAPWRVAYANWRGACGMADKLNPVPFVSRQDEPDSLDDAMADWVVLNARRAFIQACVRIALFTVGIDFVSENMRFIIATYEDMMSLGGVHKSRAAMIAADGSKTLQAALTVWFNAAQYQESDADLYGNAYRMLWNETLEHIVSKF